MTLSSPQQATINRAEPSSIVAEFEDLSANWSQQRWLLPKNRYRTHCIEKIRDDLQRPRGIAHRQLREYIAASSVTHCLDGWSYLGRAAGAHLRGDHNSSRHLGYYAELRAAMALLATAGIGVFDNKHFVVNSSRNCECIPGSPGTHKFIWHALEHWAGTTPAADLVLRVVQPGGHPLSEWLDQFSTGGVSRSVLAGVWILQWGLDLKRLSEDRNARNVASYRPTAFISPRASRASASLHFITELWEICEPSESLGFPNLDKYLLRQSLELLFGNAHGRSSNRAKRLFRQQTKTMLDGLPLSDPQRQFWMKFLKDESSRALPLLLKEARGSADIFDPHHHRQVLARAALLLRMATGACQNRLKTVTGFERSKLKFWWSPLGEDRGLWHTGDDPKGFSDLWIDVKEAINDVNLWKHGKSASDISYMKLWQEQSGPAGMLGSCERIGLWGLGL